MVYKRYVYKNGKKYGPYLYKSVRKGSKVINVYVGREEKPAADEVKAPVEQQPVQPAQLPAPFEAVKSESMQPAQPPVQTIQQPEAMRPVRPAEQLPAQPSQHSETIKPAEPLFEKKETAEKRVEMLPYEELNEDSPEPDVIEIRKGFLSRFRSAFSRRNPDKMEALGAELKRLEKKLEAKRKKV